MELNLFQARVLFSLLSSFMHRLVAPNADYNCEKVTVDQYPRENSDFKQVVSQQVESLYNKSYSHQDSFSVHKDDVLKLAFILFWQQEIRSTKSGDEKNSIGSDETLNLFEPKVTDEMEKEVIGNIIK